ncbi:ATP-binding cassette domain-containing protein [Breoghania sp. JC706]|uniref:ATP-binding cassette domain-containing protein n=1 Tax=Breoghania sp. JC706 TaxID=3117732 RepID=UPI00300BF1B7
MTSRCLEISGLTVRTMCDGRERELVSGVDLALEGGEVLALVGASGSGKSMTCAAALDVLPPGTWRAGGTVELDGQVRTAREVRGAYVATILQNPRSAFNPVRTMRSHAHETLRALGMGRSGRNARVEAAMIDAGLEDVPRILALHPFEMSGGMLQRMMVALALMSEAPFLFADEPTTDLDLIVQREILDLLERLKKTRGLGILLVTHDMGVVARLADRVAVMDAGRIVETGPVMDVFHRPAHPTTRRLVDAHLSLYPTLSPAEPAT